LETNQHVPLAQQVRKAGFTVAEDGWTIFFVSITKMTAAYSVIWVVSPVRSSATHHKYICIDSEICCQLLKCLEEWQHSQLLRNQCDSLHDKY